MNKIPMTKLRHSALRFRHYLGQLVQLEIRNSRNGFTLIELLVVIGIFAMTSVVLVTLFIGQNRVYKTETAELNVSGDARTALDDVDAYVRQALRTLAAYSSYTAGNQVLILEIQSINEQNQLLAGTFDHVVFYLTGSSLFRQVFPDAASARPAGSKLLAANVTDLAFSYDDPNYDLVDQVITDITVQENTGMQTKSITLTTRSTLRNH